MSISGIRSTTSVPVQTTASDGDSAAVEAKESRATKLAEQQSGGAAPQKAPTSGAKLSSNTNDLVKLKMYASEHMSVSEIAQRLGKSVSAVAQEAAAAGINLNTASSGTTTRNSATGNKVDTMA
jgi:hypothetical protein